MRKFLTTRSLLFASSCRKMCSSRVGEAEHTVSTVSSWDTWQGFLGCLPGSI